MVISASIATPTTYQERIPMPRDPRWISVSETAALMGVDPATVWRWKRQGDLSNIKTYTPGRHTFYWRADVEAWVKERGGHIEDTSDVRE